MAQNLDNTTPSPPLGEQELDVLRFVTDHAPATARGVAEEWGQARGLAKSTVLTVMERLRAKGYLTRIKRRGSFEYSPALSKNVLLRQLVHEFVERMLGGSFSPLVQYLAERRDLTAEELAVLEDFVTQTEVSEINNGDAKMAKPPLKAPLTNVSEARDTGLEGEAAE